MTRRELLRAFSPAQEITEPRLFAGRTKQIRAIADALNEPGSCPIIYGDRGLGKSSLAIQSQLIAMGDQELLSLHDSQAYAVPESDAFLALYATCTDEVRDFQDLLQLLINTAEAVDPDPHGDGQKRQLVDRQTKRKLSFKFFSTEVTKNYQEKAERILHTELSRTEKFERVARELVSTYKQPVLFVVDELDRVLNPSGLASFLKAVSGPELKILLVGIAQSISELLTDHQSVERIAIPINVKRMTPAELTEIVDNAMTSLAEQGLHYSFSSAAKIRLVQLSGGFPWFVHVIGQSALLDAFEHGQSVVKLRNLSQAIDGLTKDRFWQPFADLYQQAVRDSINRETTLRAFAAWSDSDVPTSEVYSVLKYKLAVTNPSVYRGHLTSEQYGGILVAPSFQEKGLLRFKNEMFKQYVRLRSSIYKGVKEQVDQATDEAWRR